MRIIAGEYRRRLLETPSDASTTRPIPDRVKESLFSLLRGHFENANVFDGFAGTGAIGLEAVSRGARRVVCVEKSRDVAAILGRNVKTLACEDRVEVICGDALGPGALARCPRPLTLAFLDPPYPMMRETGSFRRVMMQLQALIALLSDDGFAVLRTPHPLFLQAAPVAPIEEAESPRRKFRKPKGKDRFKGRASNQPDADAEDESWDSDDVETTEAAAPAPPEPDPSLPPPVLANLSLPTALGPETHIYHSMAIHLYMRKRDITPGT
jgi:16S rRNA (guanine(966)-N(2))-methyltransferase RsmD